MSADARYAAHAVAAHAVTWRCKVPRTDGRTGVVLHLLRDGLALARRHLLDVHDRDDVA